MKITLHLNQVLFKPLCFILLILMYASCDFGSSADRGKVGTPAPAFSVVDIGGNKYSSEKLDGKVLVLNFWFVACPPCIREIPELNQLVEKYKNEEVVFLAFARDSKSKLKKFLEKTRFDYNIVARSKWVAKVFNTHGWPTNIIVDKNGDIVFHKAGYDKERVTEMDGIISTLIKE